MELDSTTFEINFIPLIPSLIFGTNKDGVKSKLEKNKFKLITRLGNFEKVMRGIMRAKKAGMKVKINTVALKGCLLYTSDAADE